MEHCLELLSNGKGSVHSARIHETIESHFIMIAFANPVETMFVRQPIKEIGLPPILLSRFALIVKAEELEAASRKTLLKRKILGEIAASDLSRWHLPWLREARKHHPKGRLGKQTRRGQSWRPQATNMTFEFPFVSYSKQWLPIAHCDEKCRESMLLIGILRR